MRDPFKLLNESASIDFTLAYAADLRSVLPSCRDFVCTQHANGAALYGKVEASGASLLELDATYRLEKAQAQEATAAQNTALGEARERAQEVRRFGKYLTSELSDSDPGLAAEVRTATGSGSVYKLERQSGIRRLLSRQILGLRALAPRLRGWPQAASLLGELEQLAKRLDLAVDTQALEQMQADHAQDRVAVATESFVAQTNHLLRFLNINPDRMPDTAYEPLKALESRHVNAFNRERSKDENPSAA